MENKIYWLQKFLKEKLKLINIQSLQNMTLYQTTSAQPDDF